MPKFFLDYVPEERFFICGEDGRHIARSLRMKAGDPLTVCDSAGVDYHCEIVSISAENEVEARVLSTCKSCAEATLRVTLCQCLPKADKMDGIVQKAVELGVFSVVPVESSRCVSRPDMKSAAKKTERWQRIADAAAKQCGRGILPRVGAFCGFYTAIKAAAGRGPVILFYEGGGEGLLELAQGLEEELTIFIGPEGGFSEEEVRLAQENGARLGTLGPRILRTETAPIAALAALMLATGNL